MFEKKITLEDILNIEIDNDSQQSASVASPKGARMLSDFPKGVKGARMLSDYPKSVKGARMLSEYPKGVKGARIIKLD
jgi:hypothetical protein